MNEQLNKKISFAISIIQSAAEQAGKAGQPLEICYSGGKDSDVILELAKMALRGGNTAQFIKTRRLTRREQLSIARKKALKFSNQKRRSGNLSKNVAVRPDSAAIVARF